MQTWLVIGRVENWQTAFAQPIPIWGLRDSYAGTFEELRVGDLIVCYATDPVRGVIAVGRVRDKYLDRTTLVWPDETTSGKVIWPLKFRLNEIEALPQVYWEAKPGEALHPVSIVDFGLNWRVGFQRLTSEQVNKIFDRIRSSWTGVELEIDEVIAGSYSGEKEAPAYQAPSAPLVPEPPSAHRKTQEVVSEIGRLQHYFTEIEFPISLSGQQQRLDVVWKREHTGVPTFAFEIEFSNNVERAVARLRVAFQRWNSQPRLIADETDRTRIENLIIREERAFQSSFRWIPPSAIERVLKVKRDLKELEQGVGLY